MKKFCIIGAGVAGVSLAKKLNDCIIVEKSRGVGGRLAARRLAELSINHGAQNFYHSQLKINISDPHLWIKQMAKDIDVMTSWEAEIWKKEKDYFEILDKNGHLVKAQNIILTLPAPQAKKLLERSGFVAEFLNEVDYKSEIQFMALMKVPYKSDQLDKFLTLIEKKISGDKALLLYHLKPNYISDFIERDKLEIKEYFRTMLQGHVIDCHAHKWRYSEATKTIPNSFQLMYKTNNIYLTGDYFKNNGIEGTLASVDYLISFLNQE